VTVWERQGLPALVQALQQMSGSGRPTANVPSGYLDPQGESLLSFLWVRECVVKREGGGVLDIQESHRRASLLFSIPFSILDVGFELSIFLRFSNTSARYISVRHLSFDDCVQVCCVIWPPS